MYNRDEQLLPKLIAPTAKHARPPRAENPSIVIRTLLLPARLASSRVQKDILRLIIPLLKIRQRVSDNTSNLLRSIRIADGHGADSLVEEAAESADVGFVVGGIHELAVDRGMGCSPYGCGHGDVEVLVMSRFPVSSVSAFDVFTHVDVLVGMVVRMSEAGLSFCESQIWRDLGNIF